MRTAPGTSPDGPHEAYLASLSIYVECSEDNARIGTATTGDVLERLLATVNLRANGFHPRTSAFSPFHVDGAKFADLLERNWSSIEAAGPEVVDLGDALVVFGTRAETLSFRRIG